MIKHLALKLFSFLLIFITQFQNCDFNLNFGMTEFEYDQYPSIPFEFEKLSLEATLEPDQNLIKGVAGYTMKIKAPVQDQLVLHTAALEIDGVTLNNAEIGFLIKADSLIIPLEDSLEAEQEVQLAITWQAQSIFGTHKDRFGTMWAGLNPLALRHWLPVYDHPSVETVVEAEFIIPADLSITFNGNKLADELLSTEQKRVRWETSTPVPVTGLSFVLGNFVHQEAMAGTKKIRVYGAEEIINQEEISALLAEAIQTKRSVENALSFEFPYESLNIIVLEDSYWDEIQSGAGIIYLYKNLGNLSAQLKRGIYGQWFGQYQRIRDFEYGMLYQELLKTALHYSVYDESALLVIDEEDPHISSFIWNELQNGFKNQDPFFRKTITGSLEPLIKSNKGLMNDTFYTDFWYAQTGLNWKEMDIWGSQDPDVDPDPASPEYSLSADYDEVDSKVVFAFEHINGDSSTLSGLNAVIYTMEDSTTQRISFTGQNDRVQIDVPMNVEYVALNSGVTAIDQIQVERFPLFFLLNQLRSNNIKDRETAARLLQFHTDNPDLQLALRDALESETNAIVKARLLETFGLFTKGASGTEQVFLQELNNESEAIQIGVIKSLSAYQGNEMVQGSIRNKAIRTENRLVFDEALKSYKKISSDQELVSLASTLLQADPTGVKTFEALKMSVDLDSTYRSFELLQQLSGSEFPPKTRFQSISLLLDHINKIENRTSLFEAWLMDFDPRIRFTAMSGIDLLSKEDSEQLLELVDQNKADFRFE